MHPNSPWGISKGNEKSHDANSQWGEKEATALTSGHAEEGTNDHSQPVLRGFN